MHSKKKVSDQASVCAQKEDKEWKYQKKSIAGDLIKARLKTHLFISALISMIVSICLWKKKKEKKEREREKKCDFYVVHKNEGQLNELKQFECCCMYAWYLLIVLIIMTVSVCSLYCDIVQPELAKLVILFHGVSHWRRSQDSNCYLYIFSRLDYCNCLLMCTPNSGVQPLQKIQNFVARLVLLKPRHLWFSQSPVIKHTNHCDRSNHIVTKEIIKPPKHYEKFSFSLMLLL